MCGTDGFHAFMHVCFSNHPAVQQCQPSIYRMAEHNPAAPNKYWNRSIKLSWCPFSHAQSSNTELSAFMNIQIVTQSSFCFSAHTERCSHTNMLMLRIFRACHTLLDRITAFLSYKRSRIFIMISHWIYKQSLFLSYSCVQALQIHAVYSER